MTDEEREDREAQRVEHLDSLHVDAEARASTLEAENKGLRDLGEHKNWELSFHYGDEDDDGAWLVHAVNGGRNDREWTVIGRGDTPAEAIRQALAKDTPQ